MEIFENFDRPSMIEDFVFELFWKDLSMRYRKGIKWDMKY